MSANTNLVFSYGSLIAGLVMAYSVPFGVVAALPLVLLGCYLNRRAIPRRPTPSPAQLALAMCSVAVFAGAVLLHLLWLQVVTLIIQLAWAIRCEFWTRRLHYGKAA
jgi:hypothetical protein